MSLNVVAVNRSYRFEFLVRGSGGEVLIPIVREIRAGDLDRLLIRSRNFWTEIAISTYSNTLSATRTSFSRYIRELAQLGAEAWTLIFGLRFGSLAGSPEALGEMLQDDHSADERKIQITYSDPFGDFIFPWSILYDPSRGFDDVDPLAFWGVRYQIEQVTDGPKRDFLDDEPVDILFGLDPSFGNSNGQKEQWARYQAASRGRLNVSAPASDEGSFLRELVSSPAARLVYLYCHGYAAARPSSLRPDGVRLLKQKIEALDAESPERHALETLLSLTGKMNDESWIYLGGSEVNESKLRFQKFFHRRRPIVFLNMCQSAELIPSMSEGLTRVFLDHDAAAVIGTESPISAVFASAFAGKLLESLLSGSSVGTALLLARRHFMTEERNPLGLAYTLYGRATAKLGATPLITAPEKSETHLEGS